MALSFIYLSPPSTTLAATHSPLPNRTFYLPSKLASQFQPNLSLSVSSSTNYTRWRANKFHSFPRFFTKAKDSKPLSEELLDSILLLDRGASASPEDQQNVDRIARKLEAVNPIKEPIKSNLLNGKWELIYTTSTSILQTGRPEMLRSRANFQAINADILRAQNMESFPFFNEVTADLTPECGKGCC